MDTRDSGSDRTKTTQHNIVEVKEYGFKTKRLTDVHIPKAAPEVPTTTLQVHLEIKPSNIVVY